MSKKIKKFVTSFAKILLDALKDPITGQACKFCKDFVKFSLYPQIGICLNSLSLVGIGGNCLFFEKGEQISLDQLIANLSNNF